jgi:carbon monoxide dehydrogenase subunit G
MEYGTMTELSRTIWIDAPLDQVFAFMDDPANQPRITPSMTRIENIERLENGGSKSDYTYRFFGVPFRGSVQALEYRPNKRIVFEVTGAVVGKIRWDFAEKGGGTDFTYYAQYEMPFPILSRVFSSLINAYNEREIDQLTEALKRVIEEGRRKESAAGAGGRGGSGRSVR